MKSGTVYYRDIPAGTLVRDAQGCTFRYDPSYCLSLKGGAVLLRNESQLAAESFPAGKSRVHQCVEVRAVAVRLKVRQFVHHDVLDKFPRDAGERGAVGYGSFRKVARSPQRFHIAQLPRYTALAKPHGPLPVQLAKDRCQMV